jgi:hypothetical protein
MAQMRFSEAMVGTWTPEGGGAATLLRFDVVAEMPSLLRPFGTVEGRLTGIVRAAGLATEAAAVGTIEVSPVEHRRIRYTLEFAGDDGRPLRLDGWKSIRWLRPLSTWTTLPSTIYDADGQTVGTSLTRFPLGDTLRFLGSMRASAAPMDVESRRWHGTRGRMEVWYDTFTDPDTGAGFWLHHELVAPTDGGAAHAHGWAATFPVEGEPRWERFGPVPVGEGQGFSAGDVVADPGVRRGAAGPISWDLRYEDRSAPLFTFPAATWRRELLPAAQVVPSPTATFTGTVRVDDEAVELTGARGAAARIYGHGNAERWGWLHADLGGGDVLEIVAAVSRRPGLSRLRPLPFVQLRVAGEVWPARPLLAAARFRADLGLPTWTVEGTWRGRHLRVTVTQPPERCVRVPYTDPDGATATCTNTERADVHVSFGDREWRLEGTGHAEIGSRP